MVHYASKNTKTYKMVHYANGALRLFQNSQVASACVQNVRCPSGKAEKLKNKLFYTCLLFQNILSKKKDGGVLGFWGI